MSYRIRFTLPDGRTGLWNNDYPSREAAQRAIDDRLADTGLAYTVEEVPERGSTAAHHVEILRKRVKELEEVQKAMSRDLLFALEIGQAMREAMRTGEWRAGHDKSMANSAISGWDRLKESLAKAPSVPVGASDAPREGGDSDRRRLEALERWLRGDTQRLVFFWKRQLIAAISNSMIDEATAPTLAALADKLAAKEDKP